MRSAFNPGCRYDKTNIELIGNVFCPNTMCLCKTCVPKRIFQSSSRSYCHFLDASWCDRCAIFHLKNKQTRIFWSLIKRIAILKKRKNQFKMLLEMCVVMEGIVRKQSVSMFQKLKENDATCYERLQCKSYCHVLNMLLRTGKQTYCCLVVLARVVLSKRRVVTTKTKNNLHFGRNFSKNHNQPQPNLTQKKQTSLYLWQNRINSPLFDTVNLKLVSIIIS